MKRNKRREFMKKGLAGMFGAALIPGFGKAAGLGQAAKAAIPALPGRKLGKTGLTIPLLSMGTGEVTSTDLIRMGYDAGIKLFFSATYYGRGNNERLVGEALRALPRDSFVVGTAAVPEGLNPRGGTFPKELTAQGYMKTAEDSLKRFGLEYVDILLLPFTGKKETVLFEPAMEAMAQLKKQGKIRFAGIATHGFCDEALKAAAESKFYDVAMTSHNFKAANKEAMTEALAVAGKAGLGVLAMKTTAGGGRAREGAKPVNTTAALKWALQDENVASVVSGMTTVEELKKNLEMIKDLRLSEQELTDLGLGAGAVKSEAGLYCQQCQACLPQCPRGLDIPTLMRSYMYAYGYRNIAQARSTLDTVEATAGACAQCDTCRVNCASGFDVKDRVQDIIRLKEVPLEFIKG